MPKKAAQIQLPSLGKQYGKPDIERLGIFIEASYMNGMKYVSPFQKGITFKGKNMLSGGRKSKNATQHGYFDSEYRRLFEGEGINWKKIKEKGAKATAKGAAKPVFMPTGPSKWHSTPGDHYGCFQGIIEHFSNERNKKPKYVRPKANFTTRPIKQGGPGYADICLSKYPEHLPDPYKVKPKKEEKGKKKVSGPPMITTIYPKPYFDRNPFLDPKGTPGSTYVRPKPEKNLKRGNWIPTGPPKWQGGMHAGCFDKFPEWMAGIKPKLEKKVKQPVFYPQSMALKSMFTAPVLHKQVDTNITYQNYNNYEPRYTKYLLD